MSEKLRFVAYANPKRFFGAVTPTTPYMIGKIGKNVTPLRTRNINPTLHSSCLNTTTAPAASKSVVNPKQTLAALRSLPKTLTHRPALKLDVTPNASQRATTRELTPGLSCRFTFRNRGTKLENTMKTHCMKAVLNCR